jgi:hypothetical protein
MQQAEGIVPIGSGILHLTRRDVSRNAQTTNQGADHFEAEASVP